jgi:PRA1 family protein 1
VGRNRRGWEEKRRFEELDSEDEDDGQGVDLGPGFQQKRFASDELRFTGIDLSSRAQQGRHNVNDEDSDYSDDDHFEDDEDGGRGSQTQLALRDKEDYLVQTALERIHRAQMLGKRNVRLSQDEMKALDAFERKRAQQQQPQMSPAKSKEKKSGWSRPKPEEKKKSKERTSTPPKITTGPSRSSRGRASGTSPEESAPPYPLLPYHDYPQSGAQPSPPLGYYTAPAVRPSGSSSRPSSRSASSQSLRQQQQQPLTPPLPPYSHPYQQPRYYAVPDQLQPAPGSGSSPRMPPLPRPLPDDPNWAPRARSTSNLVPYPPDQYAYQAYAPPGAQIDPRYAMQGRRHISGPPDVHYPSMRPPPPDMYPGIPSDPYLMTQRQPSNEDRSTENEDDEDDDEDNGVQVEVVERPSGYETRVNSGAGRGGRQRKGSRR